MGKIILPDRGKFGFVGKNSDVSDGYHTFGEIYHFRMLYNAMIANEFAAQGKSDVHKSYRHSDGELCFGKENYFVVVMDLPTGQVTNHYRGEYWDIFRVPERERAAEWDGHTPAEAAERMMEYLKNWPVTIIGENRRDILVGQTWRRMAMIEQYGTRAEVKTARTVMKDAGDMEGMSADAIPAAVQLVHEIFFDMRDRYKRDGKVL